MLFDDHDVSARCSSLHTVPSLMKPTVDSYMDMQVAIAYLIVLQ